MKKQNLWFLTLFSLILVLGVYYVTMPNDLFLGKEQKNTTTKKTNSNEKTKVTESTTLEAMRVNLEEEREEKKNKLQSQLTNEQMTAEEKNNTYEQLKYLTELQGKEEKLEKILKEEKNLDCFVKIEDNNISTVCISSKHDNVLANEIMRLIQKEYKDKVYITVKFEKK